MNISGALVKLRVRIVSQLIRLLEADNSKLRAGGPWRPSWKRPSTSNPYCANARAGSLSTTETTFVAETKLAPLADNETGFTQSALVSSTIVRLKFALVWFAMSVTDA